MEINYFKLGEIIELASSEQIELIKKSYLELLDELTETPEISTSKFITNINSICSYGCIWVGVIGNINDKEVIGNINDKEVIGVIGNIDKSFEIVGSGTIIIEQKIIRGGKSVGHIEDIVVKKNFRGKKISQNILNLLKDYAEKKNCYKVILDCVGDVVPVYKSNGFEVKGVQMVEYFTSN
jgi:GNAT superfamily N-acetyltransferase